MHQRGMQADDAFTALGEPFLHRLALLLGQHLVECVGVVEHEHVVAAQFLGTQVFPMLRHVHLEAVFVTEQDEPPIDLRRFGMAIVAGVGIHQ